MFAKSSTQIALALLLVSPPDLSLAQCPGGGNCVSVPNGSDSSGSCQYRYTMLLCDCGYCDYTIQMCPWGVQYWWSCN